MNFVDGKEFYSDFNDYKLTVNTPKNYVVWATGDLQNPGRESRTREKTLPERLPEAP